MCGGKKKKSKPPAVQPPPVQPPKQVAIAAEATGVDKNRNMNRGMGPKVAAPTESMLTGNDGVDQEELKKRLGSVQLLGGRSAGL